MKKLLDARVAFGDPEIIEMIAMADQIRALRSWGWSRFESAEYRHLYDLDCETWGKPDGDGLPLVVTAVSGRVADRCARIGDLIHDLARSEEIGVLRVVRRMLPRLPIGEDDP